MPAESNPFHGNSIASTRSEAGFDPTDYGHVAPDCENLNFYDIDPSFQASLRVNSDAKLFGHFDPYFKRLGAAVGGDLDRLARIVDRNPPVLEQRDRYGRDRDRLEYHPAYRQMEKIGFEDFQLHSMCHVPNALGWEGTVPQVVKYAAQYLFAQSEIGMMCPLNMSDATLHVLKAFGSEELKDYLLPKLLAPKLSEMWKATQWMTEKAGGSDVGALETVARNENGVWRLYGEKWFASHTDAEVALALARPEGAPPGVKGVAMFAVPRYLADGSRNKYRIVRIKDKLGTRSLASCEVVFEGAVAHVVGQLDKGIKQMMEEVNMSRLSHGVRAAGQMRRCYNEAMQVARNRDAFGVPLIDLPLMRRQIMKILVPAEQSLALIMLAAEQMDRAHEGSKEAQQVVRILTPLLKLRACRDAVIAARSALESRAGNGVIEEWVNSRLVRDAHISLVWEGTSNINAIDVVRRAMGKVRAHESLKALLLARIAGAAKLPAAYRDRLVAALNRSFDFAVRVASTPANEHLAREASAALYNAASAVILAWESVQAQGDPRKLLLSRFVLEHMLEPIDPLAPADGQWEQAAYTLLFQEKCTASLEETVALVSDDRPRAEAIRKSQEPAAKVPSLV
jgi:acyl-CoA dehydrogenase